MKKISFKFIIGYALWRSGFCSHFKFTRHGIKYFFFKSSLSMNMFIDRFFIQNDINLIDNNLNLGNTFIDIGANIGTWSLYASNIVGVSGTILCFEPHPKNYNFLSQNIKLNNFNNIQTFNFGLSDSDTLLNFTNTFDTMNHVSDSKSNNTIIVPVKKLDDFTKNFNIIDLIKIDVEGYELFVLKGAIATLRKTKKIIFESDSRLQNNYNYKTTDIINFLKNENFVIYKIVDSKILSEIPDNYFSVEGEDLVAINKRF
jgi:FkbM family methyltransferase